MQERHKNRKLYFHELAQTSQKFFIPYIKQFKRLEQDCRILEIGCGDGGNLLPFAQMGCYTLGVDISEGRIADARKFFMDCKAKGDFLASDIFLLEELYGTFDVIICHDVIEHIGEKSVFFRYCHSSSQRMALFSCRFLLGRCLSVDISRYVEVKSSVIYRLSISFQKHSSVCF